MGKNKKGKAGANKAEKNAGGEDSEPLVSKDEENDSQTEITSPEEVSTLDVQPAVTEAPQTTAPVPELVQEENKVVKEEDIQPVIAETVISTEEAAPETVGTAEPTGEAPATETEPVTVVDQTQETEQPKDEQPREEKPKEEKPKKEQPKEEKPADEKPAEEHHERTYAEVVASNIPEERDSLNEDHPLMGDSESATSAAAKPAQPAPEFDETSELTVEPVTSAEATSAPVAVAKEAPKEAPKEESSFFTCLSSFKFW